MRTTLRLHRTEKAGILPRVFLLLTVLLFAAAGIFAAPFAQADGTPAQIRSAKIMWVTQDSTDDGQVNRLFLRKDGSDSEISMQFQIDVILTGREPHEPGSVRILFPRQIWHARDTYYGDGAVQSAGYGGMNFSVPDAPSENSEWHWEEAENGQYAIVNDAALNAAAMLKLQCTITGIQVSKIVDMRPSDPLKATVEVTTRSGVKDTMSTQELTAVIDTRERLSDPGAKMSGLVYSTPESVPSAMKENLPGGKETANKYVYVRWTTWPLYEGTQYFSLDLDLWAGAAEGNGISIPGIILGEGGAVSGGTVGTETSGEQPGEHYSRQTLRYGHDGRGWNDYRAREIWVAYPTDQMQNNKTYTIRAASQWTLTEADPAVGSDPREVSRAGAAASVNYLHAGWEYPAGTFSVYKYSGSQPGHTHNTPVKDRPDGSASSQGHKKDKIYEMAVGALRNGNSVTLDFEVLTTGYGYSYTAGPTSEVPDLPEGWEQDPAHYLNWTYRMETTDDTVSVANISPEGKGNLGAGDYRFDSITIAAPEMFSYGRQTSDTYQLPGSEFGYRPDSRLPKPDVEVWIEKNKSGSWELYQTVSVRSGTRKITFPADANVTGYRTVIATNQAACKLAVWPKITILPSEHVLELAEERLQDYTNVVLKNEARQVTTFYWSAERQDEVLPEQTAWLEANDDYTTESSDDSLSTLTLAGFKVYGSVPADYTESRSRSDPVKRRVVVTLFAAVYEQSNLTDENKYREAVATGAITPETSGTWYLLLPKYFEPIPSTIHVRDGDRVTDVKVTENYKGSNRTLVTVKATLKPNAQKMRDNSDNGSSSEYYTDKPRITMDMYVPWSDYDNVRDGHAVYHAAFESGNPGRLGNLPDERAYYQTVGQPDVWPGTPGKYLTSISDSQIRGWMSDLDPDSDEERFVYMRGLEDIQNADLSEQVEFRKDARADRGDIWGRGTQDENQVTVTEGGKYTYRLTVASRQDSKTGGILIYDKLEAYVPHEGYDQDDMNRKKAWSGDWQGKGQWKGTLESVDLKELIADGCGPKLYYSTLDNLVFDDQIVTTTNGFINFNDSGWGSAYRLTDETIWKEVTGSLVDGKWTVPDELLGKVTAIAVDAQRSYQGYTSYVLQKKKKVSVYLNMAAPTDSGNDSTWSAKGAYAHKRDNAASTDDIDWTGAGDPANNMYAYNAATTVFIPFAVSGNSEQAQGRVRMASAYSRVGIVPGVISVRKTWNDGETINNQYMENRDGLRPDSVTVRLKGRTSDPDSPKIDQEITLTAGDGWKGVFLNAPDTDGSGNPYTYTVTEDPVPGYTTAVCRETGRSWEIVNTHEREKITITGRKLWLNPDGTQADPPVSSISLTLRRINEQGEVERIPDDYSNDGPKVTQPSKDNSWTYTFAGYDRYAPGGYEYKYVLLEGSTPEGWFSQNDTPPAGVTVTAEYDPEDITTFRNFKKPDFGYAMIYNYLSDESQPKDGNTAVPSFTFTVDLKKDNAALAGEYEYILYDKRPQDTSNAALPAGTAQIGSGTIRHGDTFTLLPDQTMVIIGIPGGTSCTVTETVGAGWKSNREDGRKNDTIQTGETQVYWFRNTYKATTPITITGTKRLRGREQKAKEFAFNLSDFNQFSEYGYENDSYGQVIATVKTGGSRGTVTEADGTKTGLAMFTFRATYDGNSTYTMYEYGGTKVLHYIAEEALPTGAQFNADGSVTWKNVTYDLDRKDVTVTITDNMDGTLKVTSTPLVFTNTYRLQKKISLTAHKELVGRTLQPDEFSFEVRRSGAAVGSAPIARGKNDADGNVTFTPEITLTEQDLAAISAETGIGEVKFLISEVQGTDPTVAYMTAPAEAVVQIALTDDGKVLTALPGQQIRYAEEICTACGGSGTGGGLKAAVFRDLSDASTYDNLNLNAYFNDQYMEICGTCHGTGYDPEHPETLCSTCNGVAVSLKKENGYNVLHLPDGTVIWQNSNRYTLESFEDSSIDASLFRATSHWYIVGYGFTEEHWNSVLEDPSKMGRLMDSLIVICLSGSADDECTFCHGTGKVNGEPYVDGEAEPVALVNRLKTSITLTAKKTMEGQPAAAPFDFALYETDEARSSETPVATAQNGPDGTITFPEIRLDPNDMTTHFYIIREVPGEDGAIEYDRREVLYKVAMIRDNDITVPAVTLLSDTDTFENAYKGGRLAVTVNTGGFTVLPGWWWRPTFQVTVTLTDRDGQPLANRNFGDIFYRSGSVRTASAGTALSAGTPRSGRGASTDSEGRITLEIEGGKTAVISNLPHGATYKAEQPADRMPDGFSQGSADGAEGTITAGKESAVTFNNDYNAPEPSPSEQPTAEPTPEPTAEPTANPTSTPQPPAWKIPKTGDSSNIVLCLILMVLGMAGIRILRRKSK